MRHLISIRPLSITLVFALAVSACLSKSSTSAPPGSTPPAAGSTGAFGIITVNGKQKMYLPASLSGPSGHGFIAVVDAGVAGRGAAGAPALVTTIDLGSVDVATATGGDSSVVIAASTSSPKVWFIDPATDTLVGALTLDASYGMSGFSGGGGYVTGVAVDSVNHRAILSTWNGFALVDLTSRTISKVIQAPPTENFGFDSVHGRIIAPFYDCSQATSADGGLSFCGDYKGADGNAITDGLNVIDLSDETIYTYRAAGGDAGPQRTSSQPLGGEPDSAAIDPTTQIAVVPSESEGSQNVLDLSKAVFDKGTRSFTAPLTVVQGQSLEGVAIEPSSHLGFFEAEHSSDVGVIDVTQGQRGRRGVRPRPDAEHA